MKTRQLTHITDATDTLFLSREACSALGIITKGLSVASCPASTQPHSLACDYYDAGSCKCPQRKTPPPIPVKLPYPPTDKNREKLQEYLVNYYRASAFNTGKSQQLPMMDCTPLKLMVDPDATPFACHSPIPVPLHWQQQVKEGLDQDVRLGVLEPDPFGEPVTWCHRMVVCAKKNGEPCRAVDLQALNRYTLGDTAHTFAIPPIKISPQWPDENCLRCLEWLP